MSLPTFNTKSPTIKRILKEASELRTNPDPTLHAAPLESNLFEWHFTLRGPPSTPYATGIYHGRILLPPTYPLRPPSFRFLTPSGRFEVNREICLSISGHHEETWQPAWGIRTALWALRAFMEGGAKGQVGGMEMGEGERGRLAGESKGWRCLGCGAGTNEEILQEEEKRLQEKKEEEQSEEGKGKDKTKNPQSVKEQIPDELRFGFRDEMAENNQQNQQTQQPLDKGKAKEPLNLNQEEGEESNPPNDDGRRRRPSQHFAGPEDLRSSPPPPAPTAQPPPTRTTLPSAEAENGNGVPPWVDKAIVGVIAGLAVMVVKKVAT